MSLSKDLAEYNGFYLNIKFHYQNVHEIINLYVVAQIYKEKHIYLHYNLLW